MIFANLKNGCKRACNLVKNSRAVRFCALVAVCLTFNVATALADRSPSPPSSAMPLPVSWPSSVPSPCM